MTSSGGVLTFVQGFLRKLKRLVQYLQQYRARLRFPWHFHAEVMKVDKKYL